MKNHKMIISHNFTKKKNTHNLDFVHGIIKIVFICNEIYFVGLIMYNAGKHQDFVAIELVNGHIVYVFNLGYGSISIKDNCPYNLNDNQWHTVTVGRPSNYKHTLLVDTHLSAANSR